METSIIDDINNFTGGGAGRGVNSNYQDFLRLLTTQLQNQDPTAPADTNQLTQQIATLSQVEQQITTNNNLEQLISLYNATQYNSLVGYIGNQIEAPGYAGYLQDNKAPFVYYLGSEAAEVTITIKDSTGAVVYTGEGPKSAGRTEFVWDGKNNEGIDMADGTYTIEVKAKGSDGKDMSVANFITGIVTSVDSSGGMVYLSIGDMSVPLQSITSVREPKTA